MLDFVFARAWGVPWAYGTNATAARTVVGTLHYCQPEQSDRSADAGPDAIAGDDPLRAFPRPRGVVPRSAA
ncbi:MAG: hypothetical protein U0168_26055 [Nannocystaceae bacterium]